MNTLHDTIQQLEAQAASDAFSGVISWAQGEETLFEKAYGFADRSNRIANRIDTRFGIASGTKG
ncbi:MAG: serine hydrolase, partial [Anaerolineae bacterium]|nr:serine hydrolase [Anaerolineae bacterium]